MKPREKILKYWPEKLESWELVATILGSGIQWLDVFQLSKKANKVIEEQAGSITIADLEKIRGIGKIKAIQIISAFELAKRHFIDDNIIIESIWDVLEQVAEYRNKKQEYLIGITLDGANRLINKRIITIWLLNQSLVHPREVFADAIEDRAHSIILVHNHPSWTNKPSKEDVYVTKRLEEVSKIIWINLRDHIIVTKDDYYSFKENTLL
jgi:DNA repair protein RadC